MSGVCPVCGGSFATPRELVVHLNRVHAGGDPARIAESASPSRVSGAVCPLRGLRFLTPQALASHTLRPHPMPARVVAPDRPAVRSRGRDTPGLPG